MNDKRKYKHIYTHTERDRKRLREKRRRLTRKNNTHLFLESRPGHRLQAEEIAQAFKDNLSRKQGKVRLGDEIQGQKKEEK